jgi:hypothetical protein
LVSALGCESFVGFGICSERREEALEYDIVPRLVWWPAGWRHGG